MFAIIFIEKLNESLRKFQNQFDGIKEQIDGGMIENIRMNTNLHNLTQDMEIIRSKSKSVDDSLGKLENQIGGIEEQMETHKDSMTKGIDMVKSEMGNKFESVHAFLENMQSRFDDKMKTSLHNFNQDMETVKFKSKSVDDSLGKLENKIGGIDEQMKTHKYNMTKNIDVVKSEKSNKFESVHEVLEKMQSQFDEKMKTHKDYRTKNIDVVKSEMNNKFESLHEVLENMHGRQFDKKIKTSLHNLTQDMEIVKSKSRSVDGFLGKLENQIGGIDEQMKIHKDDMTKNIDAVKSEMKNNFKSVDDSLEKLQSQFDGTKDQMETLRDDVLKAKEEVKGVDGQLDMCFKEINDFSRCTVTKMKIFISPLLEIGCI